MHSAAIFDIAPNIALCGAKKSCGPNDARRYEKAKLLRKLVVSPGALHPPSGSLNDSAVAVAPTARGLVDKNACQGGQRGENDTTKIACRCEPLLGLWGAPYAIGALTCSLARMASLRLVGSRWDLAGTFHGCMGCQRERRREDTSQKCPARLHAVGLTRSCVQAYQTSGTGSN